MPPETLGSGSATLSCVPFPATQSETVRWARTEHLRVLLSKRARSDVGDGPAKRGGAASTHAAFEPRYPDPADQRCWSSRSVLDKHCRSGLVFSDA